MTYQQQVDAARADDTIAAIRKTLFGLVDEALRTNSPDAFKRIDCGWHMIIDRCQELGLPDAADYFNEFLARSI